MSFCTSCGHKLDGDEAACSSCRNMIQTARSTEEVLVPRRKRGRRTVLLLAALVVLAGAGFYLYGSSKTDPDDQIQAFRKAVRSDDADALKELLVPGAEGMKITDESSKQLIAYLTENSGSADDMAVIFKDQARSDGVTVMPKEFPQINLEKGADKWLVFPSYELVMEPYYAEATVNYKGTSLTVGGQSYGPTKKDGEVVQIGPLAPGEYTIKANYTGEYGKESKEVTMNLFNSLEEMPEVAVEMSGSAVAVSSNYPEADLYLNGEYTGYTVSEYKELGTIERDGSNTLQAIYHFGFSEGSSEEVTVSKQQTIELNVEPDRRDVYEGIKSTTNQHVYEWIDAFSSKDTSYLTKIRDLEYMARQEKNIQGLNNENASWSGSLNYLRFDIDSMDVDQGGDGLMYATINVETNISGETYDEFTYETIDTSDSSSFWKYDFVYDDFEESWFITGATTIKSLSGGNIETVR